MKKLLNLKYIIHIILVLYIYSCSDEDPYPRCFEDIVTCKVNGKEWRSNCMSNDPLFGCRSVTCYYYIKSGYGFDLNISNDKENTGLVITKNSFNGGLHFGENILSQSNDLEYWNRDIEGNCKVFYKDSDLVSTITIINLDTINFIVEGTFIGFTSNICGDKVSITNGHFKTKFLF